MPPVPASNSDEDLNASLSEMRSPASTWMPRVARTPQSGARGAQPVAVSASPNIFDKDSDSDDDETLSRRSSNSSSHGWMGSLLKSPRTPMRTPDSKSGRSPSPYVSRPPQRGPAKLTGLRAAIDAAEDGEEPDESMNFILPPVSTRYIRLRGLQGTNRFLTAGPRVLAKLDEDPDADKGFL
eukprot:EG_transcript_13022